MVGRVDAADTSAEILSHWLLQVSCAEQLQELICNKDKKGPSSKKVELFWSYLLMARPSYK